jgi:hypothetical protein
MEPTPGLPQRSDEKEFSVAVDAATIALRKLRFGELKLPASNNAWIDLRQRSKSPGDHSLGIRRLGFGSTAVSRFDHRAPVSDREFRPLGFVSELPKRRTNAPAQKSNGSQAATAFTAAMWDAELC